MPTTILSKTQLGNESAKKLNSKETFTNTDRINIRTSWFAAYWAVRISTTAIKERRAHAYSKDW